MVATGVNADGYREVLGLQVATSEDRRRLAGVLPRPGRPRPVRGRAGHLRRPHRAGRGDRGEPARRGLATVPHPLRREPDVGDPEELVGLGQGAAAHGLRPARRRRGARPVRPDPRRPGRQASRVSPTTSSTPAPTCSRSPPSPRRSGARSGPTTPTNGSTGRSAAAPTSSGSSPTATPSSASSAPSWPNNTTNGPKARRYLGLDVLARSPAPPQPHHRGGGQRPRHPAPSAHKPKEGSHVHHPAGLDHHSRPITRPG